MNHPKDVIVGKARVCWGFAWHIYPEGWCLPGGGRTMSRERAEAVCEAMNDLMIGRA